MALELKGIVLDESDSPDGDYPGIYLSPRKSHLTLWSMITEGLQHWAEKRRQVLEGDLTYSIYSI